MFKWLFQLYRFRMHDDSFAQTRIGILAGICEAVQICLARNYSVLLVAHFAEPFTELQELLNSHSIAYEVLVKQTDAQQVTRLLHTGPPKVLLTLADRLIICESQTIPFPSLPRTGVIVLERHPNGRHDRRLQEYCKMIPGVVELGYYLSLEDTTVKEFIDHSLLCLLGLFGMTNQSLVSSNILSRRLLRVANKNARRCLTNYPADSARQWLQLNGLTHDA
jgi:hypothetical protein